MTDDRARTGAVLDERALSIYNTVLRTAIIAAVFSVIVLGLMLANHFQLSASDPRYHRELKALKVELRKNPKDEKINVSIRKLDHRLRREYMRRIDFSHKGAYLLLIGIGAFLIFAPAAAQYRKKVFLPDADSEDTRDVGRSAMLGRRAVAAFGMILVGGFAFLAVASRGDLTARYAKAIKEYEKNPLPSLISPIDPLAGLPQSMLINLTGRTPASGSAPPGAPLPVSAPAPAAAQSQAPPVPPAGPLVLPPANPALVGTVVPVVDAAKPSQPKPETKSKAAQAQPEPLAVFDEDDYQPLAEELARNWPVFRGPGGLGIARGSYPLKWNGQTGEGILWKTEIPLPGWSSPVVWNDRVFLTGATKTKREIYCIDAGSGKLVWKKSVEPLSGSGSKPPEVSEDTGYAAPTMAVDGERVFAIFANGDVVCHDFQGKRLWSRNLGSPDSMYGYASSLAIYRSLLIVQFDQGSEEDGKSALIALQGGSGKVVWRTKRPVGNSWSTPIVVRTGSREEIITCANPWIIAYGPITGKEFWRADILSGDVAPSPSYAGGMVYACNMGAALAAIRTGGRGDITKTHVAWRANEGLPDITSPVTDGELLFLAASDATVTCYDAKKGEKVWEHYYDTPFHASPILVGNRVFLLDIEGIMHVVSAGREFKEESKAVLGEKASATPAFAAGRIYIRGTKHLYCVGSK